MKVLQVCSYQPIIDHSLTHPPPPPPPHLLTRHFPINMKPFTIILQRMCTVYLWSVQHFGQVLWVYWLSCSPYCLGCRSGVEISPLVCETGRTEWLWSRPRWITTSCNKSRFIHNSVYTFSHFSMSFDWSLLVNTYTYFSRMMHIKEPLLLLERVAHVAAVGFLSRYLSGHDAI